MSPTRRDFLKTSAIAGFSIRSFGFRMDYNDEMQEEFLSKIGICTGLANSKTLISAGYSYLEEGVRNFLVPADSNDAFREKLAELRNSGIAVEACNSFLPGDLKCVGPETHHEKILLFAETAFIRAKQAGIKTIVFGSSGSRHIPEGFSKEEAQMQFIKLCRQMAALAGKNDVVISLEPLNRKECNFINSVSEGADIVKSVDHVNFRLLADIYHMLMENEDPENLLKYGKYLYHIHIAEKEKRSAPGVNGKDFTPFFRALKKAGYKGRMSVECRWDNLEIQAQGVLKILKEQIAKV